MPGWSWAAASVRGSLHERAGEPRQDAFRAVTRQGERLLAAVVCDGAGSTRLGGSGAAIAARSLSVSAAAWASKTGLVPDHAAISRWILLARLRILLAAARRGIDAGEFATTALLIVSNGSDTIAAHVGDGAAAARTASGAWFALSWPEHGEYAGTTRFLTDHGPPALRVTTHAGAVDRLAIMTDGLERLALDMSNGLPHAPFLEPATAPLTGAGMGRADGICGRLSSFLASARVADRTDDDRTIILAAFT